MPVSEGFRMSLPIAAGKSSFDLIDSERVFSALHLQPDSVLVDLACGSGAYSLAAAERIGPAGSVHAFDMWREGIAALRQSARQRGMRQVRAEVADIREPLPLPPASCDLALMATVLHDLAVEGGGEAALREAARLLRPGGRLVVIEFEKIEGPPGPPLSIRLSPAEVESLVVPSGFRCEQLGPAGGPLYLFSFTRQIEISGRNLVPEARLFKGEGE